MKMKKFILFLSAIPIFMFIFMSANASASTLSYDILRIKNSYKIFHFDASGTLTGEQPKIESNVSWEVTSKPSWLEVINSSGGIDNSLTEDVLEFEVGANINNEQKNGTVVIEGGTKRVEFYVAQAKYTDSMFVTPTVINLNSQGELENALFIPEIKSDVSWTAESSEDWLFVDPAENLTNGNYSATPLHIWADSNPYSSSREGFITVSGGGNTYQIWVIQSGLEDLTVMPKNWSPPNTQDEELVSVASTGYWEAVSDSGWLMLPLESYGGFGNQSFMITVTENTSNTERTGTITVTDENNNVQIIEVTQSPQESNSPGQWSAYRGGDYTEVDLTDENEKYHVDGDWLSVNRSKSDNSKLIIIAEANKDSSFEARKGYVSFYMSGDQEYSREIIVTQKPLLALKSNVWNSKNYGRTDTTTVEVSTILSWSVTSSNPTWLTAEKKDDNTLRISLTSDNIDEVQREGIVTVTGSYEGEELVRQLKVIQQPTLPPGSSYLANTSKIAQVVTNQNRTFIIKEDGSLWGFGRNSYGNLGNGTAANIVNSIVSQVKGENGAGYLSGVTEIYSEVENTMALTADGSAWVWGKLYMKDEYYEYTEKAPVKIPALNGTISIYENSYALKSDGTVWIRDKDNALIWKKKTELSEIESVSAWPLVLKSDGTVLNVDTGRIITNQHGNVITNITAVSRFNKTCLLLKSDGTIWWIQEAYGYENYAHQSSLNNIKYIKSNLALNNQGEAFSFTDLWVGSPYQPIVSYSKLQIPNPPIKYISDSFAINSNDEIYAWGANHEGQLGDGTRINRPDPVNVTNTIGQHPQIVLDTPLELSFTYQNSGYRYHYFTPEESGIYKFTGINHVTDSPRPIYPYGELYNYNGVLLASDNTERAGVLSFNITCNLTAGETYYIKTATHNETRYAGGKYDLIVTQLIKPLSLDKPADVIIYDSLEPKYYSFTPETTGVYKIENSGAIDLVFTDLFNPCFPYGKLYDSDQNLLASNDGFRRVDSEGYFDIYNTLIAGKTYYIETASGISIDYKLRVQAYSVPLFSAGETKELWITPNIGPMRVRYQSVFYEFTAPEAGDYIFYSQENDCDPYLYINDELYDDGGEQGNFVAVRYFQAGEKVFLTLRRKQVEMGNFTMTVEKDNTDMLSAKAILLEESQKIHIRSNNQNRFYKFTPETNGVYSFVASEYGDHFPEIMLYDSQHNLIKSGEKSVSGIFYEDQIYYISTGFAEEETGIYHLNATKDCEMWDSEVSYEEAGHIIAHGADSNGDPVIYIVLQPHTSMAHWLPQTATSLYKQLTIPLWTQPLSIIDAYSIGDMVVYSGKVWSSDIDNNVWVPGMHGWTVTDVLEELDSEPQEWKQPLNASDAYSIGDRVIYNDDVWECTINANTWKPGVAGWIIVAN